MAIQIGSYPTICIYKYLAIQLYSYTYINYIDICISAYQVILIPDIQLFRYTYSWIYR